MKRSIRIRKSLFTHVKQDTGFRDEECKLAIIAVAAAIRKELESGKSAAMPNLGVFKFYVAAPRRIPERKGLPALELGERTIVKFSVDSKLRKHLRTVKPEHLNTRSKYSTERAAKKLANQILRGDKTASPSIQPDTEPSASPARECSSRNPSEIPDTGDTSSAPGYTPDSEGTSAIAPVAPTSEPRRQTEAAPGQCDPEPRASAPGTEPQSQAH